MGQGVGAMLQEIDALQGSAGEIEIRMEEISNSIKSLDAGAQEVSELAVTAHSSIEKISDIANGFEV
jgi:methyl-accepting chemotaxis protein